MHNRIMKDEKLIIGLSNSLFGRKKTQQNTGATRFDSTIQVARAGGRRNGQVVWLLVRYIWSSRATQQGATLPRQGRWRGKTRHVSPLPRHHAWRGTGFWPRHGNRHGQKY